MKFSVQHFLSIFLVAFTCFQCGEISVPEQGKSRIDAHNRMKVVLDSVINAINPLENYSLNSARAAMLEQQLSATTDQSAKINLGFQLGLENLRAGRNEIAITQFSELVQLIESLNLKLDEKTKNIYQYLAIAYMRLGEAENCLGTPNPASCIIPISPEGIHTFKRGSETAIQLLEELLEVFPDDKQSQWLLNIAYMTLGEYPASVPARWLINPASFQSPISDFPVWRNEAIDLGVAVNGVSGGVCLEDFNKDGLLDLFVTSYGLKDPCKYFINTGNGFQDMSAQMGLDGIPGGLNIIHADYDNDGYSDILILRGAWFNNSGRIPNSLLRNNGDNTFTDVTISAGLLSFHPTQTACWADFNNDGFLDLFIGNEATSVNGSTLNHPSEFYLNNGDGTFSERANEVGLGVNAWVKAAVCGDINQDGFMDLFLSIPAGLNKLYLNQGPNQHGQLTFKEAAQAWNVQRPIMSFPAWFWDYNQDGREDLFVGSYDVTQVFNLGGFQIDEYAGGLDGSLEFSAMYRNMNNESFEYATESAELDRSIFAMGSNYGDLNNDSYPDFYVGTGSPDFSSIVPNRMFLNKNDGSFSEITMNGFGHIQKGHGIAFGDYDNDGDQDVYAVMGGAYEGDLAPNVLFVNPMEATNWLNIKLEGTSSNRSAIGAKIVLTVKTDEGEERKIYRTVRTGGSFGSNPLRQFFGLEGVESVQSIQIYWPGKSIPETFAGPIEMNQFLKLKEGEGGK